MNSWFLFFSTLLIYTWLVDLDLLFIVSFTFCMYPHSWIYECLHFLPCFTSMQLLLQQLWMIFLAHRTSLQIVKSLAFSFMSHMLFPCENVDSLFRFIYLSLLNQWRRSIYVLFSKKKDEYIFYPWAICTYHYLIWYGLHRSMTVRTLYSPFSHHWITLLLNLLGAKNLQLDVLLIFSALDVLPTTWFHTSLCLTATTMSRW